MLLVESNEQSIYWNSMIQDNSKQGGGPPKVFTDYIIRESPIVKTSGKNHFTEEDFDQRQFEVMR